jgi:hypothetical protein
VARVTDPYGRTLGFLDRYREIGYVILSQMISLDRDVKAVRTQ